MERLLEIVVDFGEYFSGSITGAACPVIDQAFIDDYCKRQAISVAELKNAIRQYCFVYNYVNGCYTRELEDACRCLVSFELAAIAIQIYAATKRERDEVITEKNYRNRLAEVLDCDIQIIQKWFENYQDDVWKVYYDYCSVYDEYIDYDYRSIQCKPKTGSGRYVQYPLKYAERIFSTEDLKYIAGCFTDKKLYPGDVSSITDFKRIISESNIRAYSHTNHGKTVLGLASDAYRQVFSFYLRWNGEYKDYSGRDKQLKEQFKLYIKRSNGRYWLELRDTNSLNLQESIEFKLT